MPLTARSRFHSIAGEFRNDVVVGQSRRPQLHHTVQDNLLAWIVAETIEIAIKLLITSILLVWRAEQTMPSSQAAGRPCHRVAMKASSELRPEEYPGSVDHTHAAAADHV